MPWVDDRGRAERLRRERVAGTGSSAGLRIGSVNAGPDLGQRARSCGPRSFLCIRRGPIAQIGQRFDLPADEVTVLGRHPDCGILLSHITVSRLHAEIRLRDGQFALTDLGSLNGSYLNCHPVESSSLADGDELAIGVFRLTFNAGH